MKKERKKERQIIVSGTWWPACGCRLCVRSGCDRYHRNGPEMTSLSQMSNSPHLKEETSKLKTFKVYFDTPFLYNICAVTNKAHWASIEKITTFLFRLWIVMYFDQWMHACTCIHWSKYTAVNNKRYEMFVISIILKPTSQDKFNFRWCSVFYLGIKLVHLK